MVGKKNNLKAKFKPNSKLIKSSLPWVLTMTYFSFVFLLPVLVMVIQSLRINPAQFWEIATTPLALSSYQISFTTALLAGCINGVMGTIIAWVLVRYEFPGRKLVDTLVDLPFALPTAVAGLVLATLYSQTGWIGRFFAPFGIKIAFTQAGVFVAMLFISLPFVIRTLQPIIEEIEVEVEEASYCLGATPTQTFWKVLFPPLIPPILSGVALGFSRAIGEFGSIVIIASSIPFKDLTTPVLIFQKLEEFDYDGAKVIGTVLLIISLSLLVLINGLQAWSKRYSSS